MNVKRENISINNLLLTIAAGIASLWIEESKRIPVGGQAVIEGVLMKGPEHWGLVVREPDGCLWSKSWLGSEWLKRGAWKWPVIRGFASMADMMKIGMKALSISAERALGEEDNFSAAELVISVTVALLMVAGLFIALPVWLSDHLAPGFGASYAVKNLLEGLIRCSVFVAYIAVIGVWKDIRRVFSYHGAEHKTINAYESGGKLSPEAVASCSRIHRRCGTSFLLVVVAVSIFVFSFFGDGPLWYRAAARVLLLPLVIGLSYEVIRGASKSETWGKYLIMPALSLQYLTTREPDVSMLEVAIRSLEIALDPSAALTGINEKDEQDGKTAGKFDEVTEHGSLE
ncbi:MAG: DUF1385 domain-containing protein [Synergistaceae bacterium]|jgi:uncharacterized protein YqhQ|nr:DUF1385 domain-containing protein [Synergistaceae bacterium]